MERLSSAGFAEFFTLFVWNAKSAKGALAATWSYRCGYLPASQAASHLKEALTQMGFSPTEEWPFSSLEEGAPSVRACFTKDNVTVGFVFVGTIIFVLAKTEEPETTGNPLVRWTYERDAEFEDERERRLAQKSLE